MKKTLITCLMLISTSVALQAQTNGLSTQSGEIGLGGDLLNATNINLKGKYLNLNVNDASNTGVSTGGFNIFSKRSVINSENNLYISQFYTGTTSFANGTSLALESFWHPGSQISSGNAGNFVSIHKSNLSGTNISGTTLYGYKSILYANHSNQVFGNLYHFFVDADISYQPNFQMNNHTGLYVSSLKNPNVANSYAIYTAGANDMVYHAGPVKLTKYPNNATQDNYLTTDTEGNLVLKYLSPGAAKWSYTTGKLYNSSDNVGIGTSNPTEPLTVASSNAYTLSLLRNATGGNIGTIGTTTGAIYFGSNDPSTSIRYTSALLRARNTELWDAATSRGAALTFETTPNGSITPSERLRIDHNGNIGIGTTAPSSKLHVGGSGSIGGLYDPSKAAIRISLGGNLIMDGNEIFSDGSLNLGIAPTGALGFGVVDATNPFASILRIAGSGNVGIGTTSPSEKLHVNGNMLTSGQVFIGSITNPTSLSDYKLVVNGSALFTKAVVKTSDNWPDYVFEPTYKLPSLRYVADYIKQNKHLPDVPSAKEVNEKGVNIGDTQTILLKKIEELTLYIMQLNNRIEELEKKK